MKIKSSYLLILLLCVSVFIQCCTIEKRRYTGGFHVEWSTGSRDLFVAKAPEESTTTEIAAHPVVNEFHDADTPQLPVSDDKVEGTIPDRTTKAPQRFERENNGVVSSIHQESVEFPEEKSSAMKREASCTIEHADENNASAADVSMGLSRVSLITTVGWILIMSQNINAIAIGAILLGLGTSCALLALILALIVLQKFKTKECSEEKAQMARKGIRNSVVFLLVGVAGLIGCAFVYG